MAKVYFIQILRPDPGSDPSYQKTGSRSNHYQNIRIRFRKSAYNAFQPHLMMPKRELINNFCAQTFTSCLTSWTNLGGSNKYKTNNNIIKCKFFLLEYEVLQAGRPIKNIKSVRLQSLRSKLMVWIFHMVLNSRLGLNIYQFNSSTCSDYPPVIKILW